MPRKKDCGCGGGKNCITKKGKGHPEGILDTPAYKEAMALYNQTQDPAVLAELKKVVLREEKKLKGGCGSCGGSKGGSLKECPPGYTNIGLLCSKYIPIDTSRLPWTGGYFETIERIDHGKVQNEVRQAFEKAFSPDELNRMFDPEKNGVAESFRKFGAESEEAFKDLGRKMEKAFDPNQNGVRQGFERMRDAFPNDDWWKATMSDPDTWITLIGTIAGVAAMIVSAGTAGPLVVAALGALGPSLTILGAVARGKPVDPLDIASLALTIIPGVGAAGKAVSGLDDAIKVAAQAGKSAQTANLGKVLASASNVAGKIGTAVRSGVVANANTLKTALKTAYSIVRGAPGQVVALFKAKPLGAALTNLKPGFFQLSRAQQLQTLRDMKVRVYKTAMGNKVNAGWGAHAAAAEAEGQGRINIPDIETRLTADGFDVALETILDWAHPPEEYDYVVPVVESDDPEEKAALNYAIDQKRQAEESARWQAGEAGREAVRQQQEGDWASGKAQRDQEERDRLEQQQYDQQQEAERFQAQADKAEYEQRLQEDMARFELTGMGRSGSHHKKSLLEPNMSGAGFSEDTAYSAIDMSRLVGGRAQHSYETMYDEAAEENTRIKLAAVRRRAAERTVKIQPYTQRPELLSDTFKVAQGRDMAGGSGRGINYQRDRGVWRIYRGDRLVFAQSFPSRADAEEYYEQHREMADAFEAQESSEVPTPQPLRPRPRTPMPPYNPGSAAYQPIDFGPGGLPPAFGFGPEPARPSTAERRREERRLARLHREADSKKGDSGDESKSGKGAPATGFAAETLLKALKNKKGKGKGLHGGVWYNPMTWTYDEVKEGLLTMDAYVFDTLTETGAREAVTAILGTIGLMSKVSAGMSAGLTFWQAVSAVLPLIPAGGATTAVTASSMTIAGTTVTLAAAVAILFALVAAHEFSFPACNAEMLKKGTPCNPKRAKSQQVVLLDEAQKLREGLEKAQRDKAALQVGSGAYRGAFTRGEEPMGEAAEEFYYPSTSNREARGMASAGGEYKGPSVALAQVASLAGKGKGSGQVITRTYGIITREKILTMLATGGVVALVKYGAAHTGTQEEIQDFIAAAAGYGTKKLIKSTLKWLRSELPEEKVQLIVKDAQDVLERGGSGKPEDTKKELEDILASLQKDGTVIKKGLKVLDLVLQREGKHTPKQEEQKRKYTQQYERISERIDEAGKELFDLIKRHRLHS